MDTVTRCGFVAFCGKPNVGKSTLFNRLLERPLSAATGKPQTTRHNIKGILTEQSNQFVFVDTPGIHSGRTRALSKLLNANAFDAMSQVDVAMLVVEVGVWNARDEKVLEELRDAKIPVMLCANKIDRLPDQALILPYFSQLAEHEFLEYLPVSARSGEGCAVLKENLAKYIPKREHLFEADALTDRHERFFAEELIREQLLVQLDKELPYAMHVQVTDFQHQGERVHISAQILVERESQRKILLGKNGSRIGAVGQAARLRMGELLDLPVVLKLHVKVQPNWQRDPNILASYRGGI